jgi:type IV fimbrial biogenesis protein FimT
VRGVTLVELLAVVLIVVILAMLALPVLGMIRQNRIVSGTGEVASALVLARGEAILRRTRVSLCPMTEGKLTSGWRIVTNNPGSANNQDSCTAESSKVTVLFAREEPLKTIELCTSNCNVTTPSKFVFNALGKLEGGAAAVVLCAPGRREGRQIDITSIGQVKTRSVSCLKEPISTGAGNFR